MARYEINAEHDGEVRVLVPADKVSTRKARAEREARKEQALYQNVTVKVREVTHG